MNTKPQTRLDLLLIFSYLQTHRFLFQIAIVTALMRLRALYYCKYTAGSHIFQSPDLHTLQEYLKRKGKELH